MEKSESEPGKPDDCAETVTMKLTGSQTLYFGFEYKKYVFRQLILMFLAKNNFFSLSKLLKYFQSKRWVGFIWLNRYKRSK